MYERVKIFSIKVLIQTIDGVFKSVRALVRDDSVCTFPQRKINIIKSYNNDSCFFYYFIITQSYVFV
jgi:hypothetical protein